MVNLILWGVVGLFVLILVIILIVFLLKWGKGKIIVSVDNPNVSPGDNITGNIILKLKKPIEANGLYVGIKGIAKNTRIGGVRKGAGVSSRTNSGEIFNFEQLLDKRKQFPQGEFKVPFKMKVPANILNSSMSGGVVGQAIKGVNALMGNFSSVKWYVTSRFDINGVDLSGRTQINIG